MLKIKIEYKRGAQEDKGNEHSCALIFQSQHLRCGFQLRNWDSLYIYRQHGMIGGQHVSYCTLSHTWEHFQQLSETSRIQQEGATKCTKSNPTRLRIEPSAAPVNGPNLPAEAKAPRLNIACWPWQVQHSLNTTPGRSIRTLRWSP